MPPALAAAGRRRRSVAVEDPPVDLTELWAVAADATDDAVFGVDPAGRVSGWSAASARLFGYNEAEVAGRLASFLFVEPAPGQYAGLSAMFNGQVLGRSNAEVRRRNGTVIPVVVTIASLPSGGRGVIVRNRSDLVEAESERDDALASLRRQNELWELLQRITMIANEAADMTDALHRCMLEICDNFGWQFGHTVLLGAESNIDAHIWYLSDHDRYGRLRDVVERTGRGVGILEKACESQEPVWVSDLSRLPPTEAAAVARAADLHAAFAFPIVFDHEVVAVVEMFGHRRPERDRQLLACARHGAVQIGRVAEREESRRQLSHQAMHDALTDLPNRSLFMDRLAQAVRGLDPTGPHLAVLFVDLDDFKLINDSLGHDIGDHVLRTVANRLLEVVRPEDTAARFGGDEFIVLCERLPNDEAVGEVANRILQALSVPMVLDGHSGAVVTGSVGIAMATSPDARPEHLIRDADAAMYRAKEQGRSQFNIFDTALHERARLKLSIGNELRPAVAKREIRLVYQPQFRISDGALIGVEALARWDHPTRGVLPPLDWIPVAEENQLIVPIGEWIIGEACRVAAGWKDLAQHAGMPNGLKMCVNVSAVQLARPELIDAVVQSLRATGVDPSSLCIEVTESVLMGAPGTYLEALLGLKLLGLSIAVDDFGTGYSSLAYLRRFPIDMIKVDKGFVDGLGRGDERGLAILRAVIQLSEALGVTSVAEGVETAEQAQVLAESGCFAAQGYFFGRPQSAESITELLLAQT
ncbi:MAG TPA: EAL domain-containing protein [Acidimicrobiales bacterium]|nr:EAL domain-containing protein [Acidimicrobiales bacterium]